MTASITVGNGNQIVLQAPAAVGTGGTPTPTGTFYLTEVVRPIWQPYLGPYAYATSAHLRGTSTRAERSTRAFA